MTAENLYLSTEQYLSALKKLRDKIANGEELVDVDDDFPGNKDSWCSWGLCTNNPEVFPDPQSHLWPEEFAKQQRFAPKYRGPNQWCPLDSRIRDGKPHGEAESPGSGCFYRCMVFSPKGWTSQTARTIQTAENPDDSRAQGQDRTDHTRIFSPVRSDKNTGIIAGFSAGVSYLYLDLYLARRAKDLDTSDTIAQSLSEALDGALAADEAKTIGAMLRAGRALGWIEKVAS